MDDTKAQLEAISHRQRANRFEKAARLVVEGRVAEIPARSFAVDGSEGRRYLVTVRAEGFSKTGGVPARSLCTCMWATTQASLPEPEPCSHILAALALIASATDPVDKLFRKLGSENG